MNLVVGGIQSISRLCHVHSIDDNAATSLGPYLLTGGNAQLQVIVVVSFQCTDETGNESSSVDHVSTMPTGRLSKEVNLLDLSIQFRKTGDPFWGDVCSAECRALKQRFRIPLPSTTLPDESTNGLIFDHKAMIGDRDSLVVLSPDLRSMVLVISSFTQTASKLLVHFDLHRAKQPSNRMKSSRAFPRPPSYVYKVSQTHNDQLCYVAKHPRFLVEFKHPTCVCFTDYDNALLIGCDDGAIHLVSHKSNSAPHWICCSSSIRTIRSQSREGTADQKVAILYSDGRVVCAVLLFPINGRDAAITNQHELPCCDVSAIEWVDGSQLAVVEQSAAENPCVSVFLLQTKGHQQVAQLSIRYDNMMELCHYMMRRDEDQSRAGHFHLERSSRDPSMLAISARCSETPFSLLWNWKTNVQGFTVKGDAVMRFARDQYTGNESLILVSTTYSEVEKTIFEMATVTPSGTGVLHFIDPCLLSGKAIFVPLITRRTGLRAFGRKWRQISLPHSSSSVTSSPTNYAIAGRRGVSVLRLSTSRSVGQCSFRNVSNIMKAGTVTYKWHRYHNNVDEQLFRVIAMTWWNVTLANGRDSSGALVAVIEIVDNNEELGESPTYRLVIWPADAIGHSSQLAVSESLSRNGAGIGIHLDFAEYASLKALSLQILESSHGNRACLLVHGNMLKSPYMVYQLEHRLERNDSLIVCVPVAWGEIGSPADIFLANICDAIEESGDGRAGSLSIILGVARKGESQGVDAMIVAESRILAFGTVIAPELLAETSIASIQPLPYDESVLNNNRDRLWCVRLGDGRLCIWDLSNKHEVDLASRPVHNGNGSMGYITWAGTTKRWMMSSDNGASYLGLRSGGISKGALLTSGQATLLRQQGITVFAPQPIGMYPLTRLLTTLINVRDGCEIVQPYTTVHTVFCVQLLLLRYITVREKPMVEKVVECLQQNTTPVQFQSIVVKLGRQLEGSYLEEIFPIPGCRFDSDPEDLLHDSLACGSCEAALFCIPLIENPIAIQAKCSALLHVYLNKLLEATTLPLMSGVGNAEGARIIVASAALVKALFRYSLKTDQEDQIDSGPANSYALFCGILPKRYWATSVRTPLLISPSRASRQRQIPNGELLIGWDCYPLGYFSSAQHVLSRFLVSNVFLNKGSAKIIEWSHLGAVALLTSNGSGKHVADIDAACVLSRALLSLDIDKFGALVGSITDFLKDNVCNASLSARQASCLFDLCLRLLSNGESPDTAGLLLISLVACYAANREDELAPFLESSMGAHAVLTSCVAFQKTIKENDPSGVA